MSRTPIKKRRPGRPKVLSGHAQNVNLYLENAIGDLIDDHVRSDEKWWVEYKNRSEFIRQAIRVLLKIERARNEMNPHGTDAKKYNYKPLQINHMMRTVFFPDGREVKLPDEELDIPFLKKPKKIADTR